MLPGLQTDGARMQYCAEATLHRMRTLLIAGASPTENGLLPASYNRGQVIDCAAGSC